MFSVSKGDQVPSVLVFLGVPLQYQRKFSNFGLLQCGTIQWSKTYFSGQRRLRASSHFTLLHIRQIFLHFVRFLYIFYIGCISSIKGGCELTFYTAAHQQCTLVYTEKFTLHFMHRVKNALRRMQHIFDRSRILLRIQNWTEVEYC